jgi:hypothetical protein
MISRSNGEATFQDLRILPQAVLASVDTRQTHPLPVPGWLHHLLGIRHSDRGTFEVEAVSDLQRRIHVLLLAHSHPLYLADTPEDEINAYLQRAREIIGDRSQSCNVAHCSVDFFAT